MSSNLPPTGPPMGPPPSQPPAGWQQGQPEVLQSGSGGPVPPRSGSRRQGANGGRRVGLLAAAGLLGVGVLGAGAWAGYSMFLATGDQPAEALPVGTVGYVSVDLDPSGKQKLAALRTLEKFPAFADNIDLTEDDDLRLRLFEEIQSDGTCPDVDFTEDIDPWLGNRFAAAGIDLGGEGTGGSGVTAVGVLQIDDAAAAEDGLAVLSACGGADGQFGWSVAGDWAVLAETTEIAQQVTDAAADEPLSDDEDFQRWTGEAGDPGILTAYLAPEAGELLSEAVAGLADLGGAFGGGSVSCEATAYDPEDPFGADPFGDDPFETCFEEDLAAPPGMTDQFTSMFDDFEGAAVTVRFEDGGLTVETAGSSSYLGADAAGGDAGDDMVATLPETTAVAFGVGLEAGWFDEVSTYLDSFAGEGGTEEFLALAEAETGLDLPDDLETLLGDSTAIVIDGDIDLMGLSASELPSDLLLGIKVRGDGDEITSILDRLLSTADDRDLSTLLGHDTDDDMVVAGPSAAYRATLLEDGGLGDTDAYRDAVVNSGEAASVFFVNFDAGSWLTGFDDLPGEVQENLAPLAALGLSGWNDDGVSHSVLRITTG